MPEIGTGPRGSGLLSAPAAIVVAAAKTSNRQGTEMGRRNRYGAAALLTAARRLTKERERGGLSHPHVGSPWLIVATPSRSSQRNRQRVTAQHHERDQPP